MKSSSNKTKIKKDSKKGNKKRDIGKNIIRFPAKLLAPIGRLLFDQLKLLRRRKREITEEDPFQDTSRVIDNASPDTDASEQFGHARVSAIKEQLDRGIIQTKKALTRIRLGKYGTCEDCKKMIDTDRLMVYPEATLCAECKLKRE